MDRLEKALEKARAMRDGRLAGALASAGAQPVPYTTDPPPPAAHDPLPQSPPPPRESRSAPAPKVQIEDGMLEQNRIVARQNRSTNADTFRMLRTKVLQAMTKNDMKTIAVTSPNYGDGKTTIAVNLALSLALDVKQTVLLVDLDLRHPSIHRYLNIDPKVGLSDYFVHNAPVPDCLVKPAIDRLVVLPIVRPLDNSSEMLGTPQMAQLAHELKTRYNDRIVIYDMPPLLAQDDTIAFLPHVDGVLLVVRDNVTAMDDVRHAMNVLGDANLIGTVLNNGNSDAPVRTS